MEEACLAESACLNQRPILFEGAVSNAEMPVGLTGDGLELSVLKKAEKEDVCIIRIVETAGRESTGSLELNGTITECDLMELKDHFQILLLFQHKALFRLAQVLHIFFLI